MHPELMRQLAASRLTERSHPLHSPASVDSGEARFTDPRDDRVARSGAAHRLPFRTAVWHRGAHSA